MLAGVNQNYNPMKRIIIVFTAAILFAACESQPVRYASSSPEIDIYLSAMQDYADGNWTSFRSHYADTAAIFENVRGNNPANAESVDHFIEVARGNRELFPNQYFLADEQFTEMVVTDDDETWVNYWGVWVGTLEATGQRFEIPVHFTARFVDGKIVREHAYYNLTPIVLALQGLEAAED